jgi:hypothetical protein
MKLKNRDVRKRWKLYTKCGSHDEPNRRSVRNFVG